MANTDDRSPPHSHSRKRSGGQLYGTSVLDSPSVDKLPDDHLADAGDLATLRRGRNGVFLIVCAMGILTLTVMIRGLAHHQFMVASPGPGGVRGPIGVSTFGAFMNERDRYAAIQELAEELSVLQQPPVRQAVDGVLNTTLHVGTADVTNGPIAFRTRVYEDSVPGPTLLVRPGDMLAISTVNTLGPNVRGPWSPNTMHDPNSTNIHLHGMHVDPTGIADNVLRVNEPGETMYSEFHIPENHPRGLFLYHPHYHGNVFLQMGGGMVGAVIVQDDSASMPPAYAQMQSELLIVQDFRFQGGLSASLPNAANASRSLLDLDLRYTDRALLDAKVRTLFPRVHLAQPSLEIPCSPNVRRMYKSGAEERVDETQADASASIRPPLVGFFAINGQYQPKIELRPHENRLLRFINAGGISTLELSIPGCSMRVAAMDGIYLSKPREKDMVLLSPGMRADIVINCAPNVMGDGMREALRPIQSVKEPSVNAFIGPRTDVFQGVLGFIHVVGELMDMPLIAEVPPPPALYADNSLLDVDEDVERFELAFSMGGSNHKDGIKYKDYLINHQLFDGTSIRSMRLGRVQEWVVTNMRDESGDATTKNHPFHMHTNAFQIVDASHGMGVDYEIGDWRDVIQVPTPGNVTIRFRPVDYTGLTIAHCHILGHSDAGMVAAVTIVEDEEKEIL